MNNCYNLSFIQNNIPKGCELREELVAESEELSSDDIHVLVQYIKANLLNHNPINRKACTIKVFCCMQVVTFDYGKKSRNPIDSVLFYKKEEQDTAFCISREEVDYTLCTSVIFIHKDPYSS